MKVIDAHLHIGLNDIQKSEDLIEYLDDNNIDKCWLLTWEESAPAIDAQYQSLPVQDVFETYSEYQDRVVPFYAPDPMSENSLERFKHWYEKGVRGFGELKASVNWSNSQLTSILDFLNKESLPLVFHMQKPRVIRKASSNKKIFKALENFTREEKWKGVPAKFVNFLNTKFPLIEDFLEDKIATKYHPGYMMDFGSFERVLQNYKEIKFVGHGPYFWKGISSEYLRTSSPYPKTKIKRGILYRLFGSYSNLYGDLSGYSGFNALNRDHENAKLFLKKFQNRLLFGSDNSNHDIQSLLKHLISDEKVLKKIFSTNATNLLEG